MSNTRTDGLHITPLTLTVCGALWAVIVLLASWNLAMTVELIRRMDGVPAQIADHEQRLRTLEQRP